MTSPHRRLALLAIALPLAPACGSAGSGSNGADGGPAGDGAATDDASGLACSGVDGSWVAHNASDTPDTISHDGALAITPTGEMAIAFAEPDVVNYSSDQDIYVTRFSAGSWSPPTPLTSDTHQNAFPSLAAAAETFHLVWNGRPVEPNNDIFYAADSGSGWSEPVNLTIAVESGAGRHAWAPSVAAGPNGQIAIAYLSGPDLESGIGFGELRVARLDGDQLDGAPVTVIPAGTGCDGGNCGCYDPVAMFDEGGKLHVIVDCGPLFDEDVYHATDAGGGGWSMSAMPGGAGRNDFGADLYRAADGTLWATWSADMPCADETCRHVMVSHLDGDAWAEPTDASMTGTPDDMAPTIAVTDEGRVFVAFHRDNADNKSDVFVATSSDGVAFTDPCDLTRTDTENEWFAYSMTIHPQSGLPHLTYEHIMPKKDPGNPDEPLNVDVVHLQLVAP